MICRVEQFWRFQTYFLHTKVICIRLLTKYCLKFRFPELLRQYHLALICVLAPFLTCVGWLVCLYGTGARTKVLGAASGLLGQHVSTRFFPRASERRVLPIVGVCISSSHFHTFSSSTPSHFHTFSSSHLLTSHFLIFTSSHFHILSSSHLRIFTSAHFHIFSLLTSHLLIFTSSHVLIFTIFSSSHLLTSHLLIFTFSHLHIFSSSHLLISASSHLHIFTSSHRHIFSSSHLLIFTAAHLDIFSSSHLVIFTFFSSSHLLIFASAHLHIFSSSHLHIFSSSHFHILTSSHLLLLPFCPLALLPSCSLLLFYFSSEGGGRGSANETQPFRTKQGSVAKNWGKIAIPESSRATLSHEMRFDRQKLR